jgi:hypothetical protein
MKTTGTTRSQLSAWLKGHDNLWTPDQGPIEVALHLLIGNSPEEPALFTVEYSPYDSKLAPENVNERSAESLAQEITDSADEYAAEQNQIVRYCCITSAAGVTIDRKPFVFTSHPDGATTAEPDTYAEGATDRGLLHQLMRHNEINMKAALGGYEVQLEQNRRLIEAMRAEIEQLYKDRREQVRIYEDLLSERHVRDIQIRQMVSEEKRMENAADMLRPLVPVVINKMMGTKLLQTKEHPPLEMARALFSTLTPEQMKGLLATLHPSQQAVVIELTQMFYEEHDKKQKEEEERLRKAGLEDPDDSRPEPTPVDVDAKDVTPKGKAS